MENFLPFSRIRFDGIKKKEKEKLRAMKKTTNVPPAPGFLAKFRNPLKKDEPKPKEIILTNVKHKYNPVTKKYEFEGDTEEKKEEFVPPPTDFVSREKKGPVQKYVDIIGQDVNLKDYKPADRTEEGLNTPYLLQDDKKTSKEILSAPIENTLPSIPQDYPSISDLSYPLDSLPSEPPSNLLNPEKFSTNPEPAASNPYKALLETQNSENEKFLQEIQEFISKPEVNQLNPENFKQAQLELELAETNLALFSKTTENFELFEKNLVLEGIIHDLKSYQEIILNDQQEIQDRLKEENRKLYHELNFLNEKREFDSEAMSKIKELEKSIELQQIRINLETQSRVRTELSERKLINNVKELEKTLDFALETIKSLNQKNSQLMLDHNKTVSDLANLSISPNETFEIFDLTTEALMLKSEISSFNAEILLSKNIEKDLLSKIREQDEEIVRLEGMIKNTKEKLSKEGRKELEIKVNHLNSGFSIEKNNFLSEIKRLNSIIADLRKATHDLTIQENDNKLLIDELQSEVSGLKTENSALSQSEQNLIKKKKSLKITLGYLKAEDFRLKGHFEKNQESLSESLSKLVETKTNYDKLLHKHKSMASEYERKLLESQQNSLKSESKLKAKISSQDESIKILEAELKSTESKIQEIIESNQEKELKVFEEVQRLKAQIAKELDEKIILKQELEITKDSLNADLGSLRKKFELQIMTIEKLELEVTENKGIRDQNKKLESSLAERVAESQDLKSQMKQSLEKINELNEKIEENESEKLSLTNLLTSSSDEAQLLRDQLASSHEETQKIAQSLKSLQAELQTSQSSLNSSQHQIEALDHQAKLKDQRIQDLQSESSKLSQDLLQARLDLDSFHNSSSGQNIKLKESLEQLQQTKSKLEEALQENRTLKQNLESSIRALENAENDKAQIMSEYEKELILSESSKNELSDENIRMYEEISKLEASLAVALQGMEDLILNNKSEELQKVIEAKNNEIIELKRGLKAGLDDRVSRLETKNADLASELKDEREKAKRIEGQLEVERKGRESLADEIVAARGEKERVVAELGRNNEELQRVRAEWARLAMEVKELRDGLDREKGEMDLVRERNRLMEEEIIELKEGNKNSSQTLEDMFQGNQDLSFFANPSLSNLQNEKYELEVKVKDLQEEKISLVSQIDELSTENDQLYEKYLNLESQNKLLSEQSKKSQPDKTVQDLTIKLSEKEEELKLVKENFHELLQKTSSKAQSSKENVASNQRSSWFSSAMGQIFLTDKERGVN